MMSADVHNRAGELIQNRTELIRRLLQRCNGQNKVIDSLMIWLHLLSSAHPMIRLSPCCKVCNGKQVHKIAAFGEHARHERVWEYIVDFL